MYIWEENINAEISRKCNKMWKKGTSSSSSVLMQEFCICVSERSKRVDEKSKYLNNWVLISVLSRHRKSTGGNNICVGISITEEANREKYIPSLPEIQSPFLAKNELVLLNLCHCPSSCGFKSGGSVCRKWIASGEFAIIISVYRKVLFVPGWWQ